MFPQRYWPARYWPGGYYAKVGGLPTPVRETILATIKTTLEGVTTANGYETNVGAVYRYTGRPPEEVLAPLYANAPIVLVLDGAAETNERDIAEPDHEFWTLRPQLIGIVSADALTPSTTLNKLIGDIKKVIRDNRQAWHATHALDTKIAGMAILSDLTKPHAGCDVSLEILYKTTAAVP